MPGQRRRHGEVGQRATGGAVLSHAGRLGPGQAVVGGVCLAVHVCGLQPRSRRVGSRRSSPTLTEPATRGGGR
ncbi:hypothetical protein [Ornithinimicrobium kibberense]|uniref:hypothetical protein n=1 Tax=Ornithinimicrobium kibberense TaxID=282060 RepID=UPI00361F9CAF